MRPLSGISHGLWMHRMSSKEPMDGDNPPCMQNTLLLISAATGMQLNMLTKLRHTCVSERSRNGADNSEPPSCPLCAHIGDTLVSNMPTLILRRRLHSS